MGVSFSAPLVHDMEVWTQFVNYLDTFRIEHPMSTRNVEMLLNWGHPWLPWVSVAIYLTLVFLLPKIITRPYRLTAIVALWNLGLSIFSFLVLIGTAVPLVRTYQEKGFYLAFCGTEEIYFTGYHSMLFWIYVFTLSKFYELFDTLFLILRKKQPAFLHWYHHATVLLYCWYASYYHTTLGFNFVVVNAFVHTFMYFYYFLAELNMRPPEFVALFITIIQISQMFIGIVAVGITAYLWNSTGVPCLSDEPELMLGSAVVMYASYLFLFCQFFVRRYLKSSPKPSSKNAPKQKKK